MNSSIAKVLSFCILALFRPFFIFENQFLVFIVQMFVFVNAFCNFGCHLCTGNSESFTLWFGLGIQKWFLVLSLSNECRKQAMTLRFYCLEYYLCSTGLCLNVKKRSVSEMSFLMPSCHDNGNLWYQKRWTLGIFIVFLSSKIFDSICFDEHEHKTFRSQQNGK